MLSLEEVAHSGLVRVGAAVAALTLLATLGDPARAVPTGDPPGRDAPGVQRTDLVRGKAVAGNRAEMRFAQDPAPPTQWPSPGQRQVEVPDSETTDSGGKARPAFSRAGDWPVYVGDPRSPGARKTGAPAPPRSRVPGSIQVQILDRATTETAGLEGLLLRVEAQSKAGPVALRVDYAGFAGAYGGGWGSRLRTVRYPACILSTPEIPACRIAVALPSVNDTGAATVTSVVDLASPDPGPTTAEAASETASRQRARGGTAAVEPSSMAATAAGTATVMSIEAEASGEAGDWTATPLSESSTWSAGGQSGAATWSYPVQVPPVPGSFTPKVALGYNSQVVDGRTSGRNTQGSWVGDGFDLNPGFIERKYRPCLDDQGTKGRDETKVAPNNPAVGEPGGRVPTGDLCWKSDNAILSFGGSTSELIFEPGKGYWRKIFDDGTRITHQTLSASEAPNGDDNNEFWTLTTPDGVRYFFGAGEARAGEPTNSVWTVPVFGNHPAVDGEPDEPGFVEGDFAASHRQQAWRWNLDHVRDLRGNAATYVWHTEHNWYNRAAAYGGDESGGTRTRYDRGGTLARIDYGLRIANGAVANGDKPLGRVKFETGERCRVPNNPSAPCAGQEDGHRDWWPDVPLDQVCAQSGICNDNAPTFFGRQRLELITTLLRPTAEAATMREVDRFAITYADTNELFPATLTRTALGNTTDARPDNNADYTLAPVRFGSVHLRNQVLADDLLGIRRHRLSQVINENGGDVGFTYSDRECTPDNTGNPWSNTKLCFPAMYAEPGQPASQATLKWFHKYVVTQAEVSDNSGAASATGGYNTVVTRYTYNGPAWAYDRSPIMRTENRTWNEWRGFRHVNVIVGESGTPHQAPMRTRTTYYQGMFEDRANDDPNSAQRQTKFDDSETAATETLDLRDTWRLAGMPRETIVYSQAGPDGVELSATVTEPWISGETIPPLRTPTFAAAERIRTRTTITGQSQPRRTTREFAYDAYGFVTMDRDLGDVGTTVGSADDLCTTIAYARPTLSDQGAWILDRVANSRTLSDCGATPALPAALVAHTRTFYDNAPLGALGSPTRGLVTRVEQVERKDGYGSPAEEYVAVTYAHDSYGRVTQSTHLMDPDVASDNRTTLTDYIPDDGPVTAMIVTSPDPDGAGASPAHVTSTEIDPFRGRPLTATDPSGVTISGAHDALGRLVKVWHDNRDPATNAETPDVRYQYTPEVQDGPEAVTTLTRIDDDRGQRFTTAVVLYDDLRRAAQSQTESYQEDPHVAGRLITSTSYDTRGLPTTLTHAAFTGGSPDTATYWKPENEVPAETTIVYDGTGRPVSETFTADQGLQTQDITWTTASEYRGDRVVVTPPDGAVKTATVTDARGRTTALIQNPSVAGVTARTTSYSWTPAGDMASMTDPTEENTWTWSYDLLGRRLTTNDPDAGLSISEYTKSGQLAKLTDARNKVLTYDYDNLDRPTARHDRTGGANTQLAKWTYDPVIAPAEGPSRRASGLPDTATRYVQGVAITRQVTGYDALARPTEVTTRIPEIPGLIPQALTGEYVTATDYNSDGTVRSATLGAFGPEFGRIEAEKLRYYNDELGRPQALTGAGAYVADVLRSPFGEVLRYSYGNTFRHEAWQTHTYQPGTRRLSSTRIDREIDVTAYEKLDYSYDPAGNPTKIATSGQVGNETQCYHYDKYRQLAAAWTPANADCTTVPSPTGSANPTLGGIAPYGLSWEHDEAGNRTKETSYRGAGAPVTSTYSYTPTDLEANPGPHQLTQVSGGARTDKFAYDNAGNTVTRKLGENSQSLDWDVEGRLEKVTGTSNGELARHIYDADGNRLLKRDPGGTTLYLGETELTLNPAGNSTTWQRHYDFDGQTVAVRDGNAMTDADILVADPQNTAQHAIDTANSAVTSRRTLPYGGNRDATSTGGNDPPGWTSHRGFVGGVTDTATGLIRIGARDYDATLGRFLSLDPILNPSDPHSLGGYGYAGNNPVTYSDPTGLARCDGNYSCDDVGNANGITWEPAGNTPMGGYSEKNAHEAKVQRGGGGGLSLGGILGGAADIAGAVKDTVVAAPGAAGDYLADAYGPGLDALGTIVKEAVWDPAALIEDCPNLDPFGCAGGIPVVGGRLKHGDKLDDAAGWGRRRLFGSGDKADDVVSCLRSFSAATLVLLADGTAKPISEVRIGDKVLAEDPETGERGGREVTAVWVHQDELTDLTLTDGARITTTEDHPFWNATERQWQEPQDLDAGDHLLTPDGTTIAVGALDESSRHQASAYNLTVNLTHTYYVIPTPTGGGAADPATAVLVHNCDIGESLARHIGDRQLDGVPDGGVAEYIERVIHDPTLVTQFKKSASSPESGRSIHRHGKNLIIIDPASPDGGTAFSKATEEAAREYFDAFD